MATTPPVKRARNPKPPKPRKYDATELRLIRAGMTEWAQERYKQRMRGRLR